LANPLQQLQQISQRAQEPFVFVMRADPKPKVAVRHGNGERAMTTAKASPPETSTFLKTQRAVMRIFFPELLSFSRGGASFRRQVPVTMPEITCR
jgi:hypothetical protein